MEFLWENIKPLGYFFYVMDPHEHVFEKTEDVKDYYKEVTPLFVVTVLLEQIIRYYQGKPLGRINDVMCNGIHGILLELSKLPCKTAEVFLYTWVYKNYRLLDLPWDSTWTWIAALILTDLGFYCTHRLLHQINILWAIHETHHGDEDIQFSSPIRISIFAFPVHWVVYLPMALAVHPSYYLVHLQVNVIFQYWLHTEIIDKLPPIIEYIFNTPSHHRAHHGRNRRYIDKNFGGVFIIFDRLFGTFEPEDPADKPLYGVTTQMNSFNPLYIQTRQFKNIWKKFCEYDTIGDKLSAIFKGPGWSPGKPWLGDINDIPHPAPVLPKYDSSMSLWWKYYTLIHFLLFGISYVFFAVSLELLSTSTITILTCYFTYSCITFGFLLDNSRYAPPTEFLRCILYFVVERLVFHEVMKFGVPVFILTYVSKAVFSIALAMWTSLYIYENVKDSMFSVSGALSVRKTS